MILILLFVFAMFYVTSEVVFRQVLSQLIADETYKYWAHVAIIILGQSSWILLATMFLPQHRIYDRVLFFIFIIFLYMFFMVFALKIANTFINFDMQKAVIVAVSLAIVIALLGHVNTYFPTFTRYKIHTSKNINKKIAFISDLHFGDLMMTPKLMHSAIEKIKTEKVDYLIIGGDIIEGRIENFDKYSDFFSNSGVKTFAVLGNHDYYRKDHIEGAKRLENAGINVLLDEYILIDGFYLIGREDKTNHNRKKVSEIMQGIDKSKFMLLIDHNPKFFDEAMEQGADLQLSGHTHNGQMFPFNLVVKKMYEKPYGQLDKGKSTLITSSGLAGWGPPIKIGSPVEIVIVEINNN
ncbi:MAG: metallophosphoesterase [Rickettsiales bacterium]|jgi:predicted MPP superfamily phosphohydrolase|nr:metallophosphoesterase [Rickettsiales bacterium]